jgi:hypothetical protein
MIVAVPKIASAVGVDQLAEMARTAVAPQAGKHRPAAPVHVFDTDSFGRGLL